MSPCKTVLDLEDSELLLECSKRGLLKGSDPTSGSLTKESVKEPMKVDVTTRNFSVIKTTPKIKKRSEEPVILGSSTDCMSDIIHRNCSKEESLIKPRPLVIKTRTIVSPEPIRNTHLMESFKPKVLMPVNNSNKDHLNSRPSNFDSSTNVKIKPNTVAVPRVTEVIKTNVNIAYSDNIKTPSKALLNCDNSLSAQQKSMLPQYRKNNIHMAVVDPWLRELHSELDRIFFPMGCGVLEWSNVKEAADWSH